MTKKIEEYIKLAEAATDGPFVIEQSIGDRLPILHSPTAERVICQFYYQTGEYVGGFDNLENNMAFLAASRTLGPALAKALLEAEEALKASMLTMRNHKIHAPDTHTLQIQALATIQKLKEKNDV